MKSVLYRQSDLDCVEYDPETGIFTWAVNTFRTKKGDIAGGVGNNGTWRVTINNKAYTGPRLAWIKSFGRPAIGHVSLLNGDKSDCSARNVFAEGISITDKMKPDFYEMVNNGPVMGVDLIRIQGKQRFLVGTYRDLNQAQEIKDRLLQGSDRIAIDIAFNCVDGSYEVVQTIGTTRTDYTAPTKADALAVALSVINKLQSTV